MRKPYQSPGRMKNSSYYIAPVGDWTHDLPHTVASNMVKVSHTLNHSATEALLKITHCTGLLLSKMQYKFQSIIFVTFSGDLPQIWK